MTISLQAPTEEQIHSLFDKLFEFRGTLPEHERMLVDYLVARPTIDSLPPPNTDVTLEAPPITDEEVESFTRKLEELRDNLPDGDTQLLDTLALEAGFAQLPSEATEEDVVGHHWYQIWNRYGYAGAYGYWSRQCGEDYYWNRDLTYSFSHWSGGRRVYRYTCWQTNH